MLQNKKQRNEQSKTTEERTMKSNEVLELEKRRREIDLDAERLVDRYLKIFEWETPEPDERQTYHMIIGELRNSLDRLESRL
jgi:hypothetical protein